MYVKQRWLEYDYTYYKNTNEDEIINEIRYDKL